MTAVSANLNIDDLSILKNLSNEEAASKPVGGKLNEIEAIMSLAAASTNTNKSQLSF